MNVIVLVVGTGASVMDGMLSLLEIFEDGPVDELASVIAVKAENIEWKFLFDVFDVSRPVSAA